MTLRDFLLSIPDGHPASAQTAGKAEAIQLLHPDMVIAGIILKSRDGEKVCIIHEGHICWHPPNWNQLLEHSTHKPH